MRHLLCFLLFCFVTPILAVAEAAPPNILFIVTDDQGAWAMGCSGNKDARTPSLDRIAREGVRLTNCFTPTPVCSPARASIMTSRYGSEVGIQDWINPRSEAELGLDPSFPVWPRYLVQAGYRTGLIGKWHLGTADRFHPSVFGYQHFMGFRSGGNTPLDPELEVDGKTQMVPGYVVDLVGEGALKFLREQSDKPFALSVHFREPHRPYVPLPADEEKFANEVNPTIPNPDFPKLDIARVRQYTKEYLGSIAAIDRNVGNLLDELDRRNLTENTLVIFTSDHGYNIGHHGVWHKGNGSWILTENPPATPNVGSGHCPNMFDTSLRVPALIRWPGKVQPGSTLDRTVTHLDWFPTLLEVAKIPLPSEVALRGTSIVPLLTNTGSWTRNDDLYTEFSIHNTMRSDMRSWRTTDWKLKRDFLEPERDQLFNLAVDPDETTNLISSQSPAAQAVLKDLSDRIQSQMHLLNDPLLKSLPNTQ